MPITEQIMVIGDNVKNIQIFFNKNYTYEQFILDKICHEYHCSYKDVNSWDAEEFYNKIHYLNLIDKIEDLINQQSYGVR